MRRRVLVDTRMTAALPRVLQLEAERFPIYYIPGDAVRLDERGFRACIVYAGDSGYFPTGSWPYTGKVGQTMPYIWGPTREDAARTAEEMNKRHGVSKAEADLIVLRSMGRGTRAARAKADEEID